MIRRLIDMQCASELAGHFVEAYGTSEGVKKEWDSRGRSRQEIGEKLRQNGFTKVSESQNKKFSTWNHPDGRSLSWNAATNVILHKNSGEEWKPETNVEAYGTSEGVKKAWDSRGRKLVNHLENVATQLRNAGLHESANRVEDLLDDADGRKEFTPDHASTLRELSDRLYRKAENAPTALGSGRLSNIGVKLSKGARMAEEY